MREQLISLIDLVFLVTTFLVALLGCLAVIVVFMKEIVFPVITDAVKFFINPPGNGGSAA